MSLPTSTPRAEGVDAAGIGAFLDAADATAAIDMHSLAIARKGRVITSGWWAPYCQERLHLLYSLSKSMTATAVATLVADGSIALDDPVLQHLPTEGLDIDASWRDVLVKHCLSMTVGHTEEQWTGVMASAFADPAQPRPYLDVILRRGPSEPPGSVFCYNQVATYVLSRIVAHVTGRHLLDVLRERVFGAVGVGEVLSHHCPEGFELGFSGMHMRTLDLLSMAQLWLDRGSRDGIAIVPDEWFDVATKPFLAVPPNDTSDWEQGYGFSYWNARHGYRGDGAYGQYGIVLPDRDVAIAITGETVDMQAVLDLVWEHLLPAFDGAGTAQADDALAARMTALAIPPLDDDKAIAAVEPLTCKLGEPVPDVSLAADYSTVTIETVDDGYTATFALDDGDGDVAVAVGGGAWADGTFVAGQAMLPTAASGGWVGGQFAAAIRFVETPHTLNVRADAATETATAMWHLPPLNGRDPRHLAIRSAP